MGTVRFGAIVLAFDLIVYAHLLAGGLAIAAVGWRAGWPPAASVLAAVLFMFGACASSRMQHTGAILTYAMFPTALLLLQLALQRRSIGWAFSFGVVAAVLALQRNQIALLFCFVLLAVALSEIVMAERPARYLADRLPVLATMSITGAVLLVAPALLTMQFAGLSNRPNVVLERALEASLYPANLATLVVPNIFGSHQFPPWGPNYETVPEVAPVDESFNYLLVGALPVVLLLLWLGIAGGGLWRRGRRLVSAVLLIALLYALGRYTPLFRFAFDWMPGVNLFRRPVDGVFVFLAAFAVLAGHLLSDYIREGLPRRRDLLTAAVTVAALAVIDSAVIFSARTGHARDALIATLWFTPMLALVIAALALARTTTARRWTAAGLVAVAAAELLWWNGTSRLNSEGRHLYAVLEQPTSAIDLETLAVLELDIAPPAAGRRTPARRDYGRWRRLAESRDGARARGHQRLQPAADRRVRPVDRAGRDDVSLGAAQIPGFVREL